MLFSRNQVLLVKVENTRGTDSTPTGAANAVLCGEIQPTIDGQNIQDIAGNVLQTVALSTSLGLQEITIITGLNGNQRYSAAMLSETTQFAGTSLSTITLGLGRPGSTTDAEMIPQTQFAQSSGDAWFVFDRPQPPILGSSNTYTLVIAFRVTGGTGFMNLLTAGKVTYEIAGNAIQ